MSNGSNKENESEIEELLNDKGRDEGRDKISSNQEPPVKKFSLDQKFVLFALPIAVFTLTLVIFSFSYFNDHHSNSHSNNYSSQSISGTSNASASLVAFQSNTIQSVTQKEYEHLIYMREEEKLAKDVYQFIHQLWNLSLFSSIGKSESRHTERVRQLLTRYQLVDPALNAAPGVFQNKKLSALYQQLTQQAQKSKLEALKVGALIEEVDINDLDQALMATNKTDITQVYTNLRSGSYHHLGAFIHGIELYGQKYKAQVLDQNRVDLISHSSFMDSSLLNP